MTRDAHVDQPKAFHDASAAVYVDFAGTEVGADTEGPLDRSVLAAFVELVADTPQQTVLDAGCGPGRVAAYVAERGLDSVGMDVSPALLAMARAAHPHVPVVEARLDGIPAADATFGGVVAWYSIIYTPPELLDEAIAELQRVVAAGGLVLVAFQVGRGEAVHRTAVHGTDLALTNFRHDPADVSRRLVAAGLRVEASVERAAAFAHESTPQAFLIARRPHAAHE